MSIADFTNVYLLPGIVVADVFQAEVQKLIVTGDGERISQIEDHLSEGSRCVLGDTTFIESFSIRVKHAVGILLY